MNKPGFKACVLTLAVSCTSPAVIADHPSNTFGANQAGPLITIPAAALPADGWSLAFRTEQLSLSPLSNAVLEQAAIDGEALHSIETLTTHYASIAYGVTDRLTLGLTLPYVSREGIREGELHGTTPEVHAHQDADGLGDATLLGQYLLPSTDTALSLLFGVQLATGDDQVKENGNLVEAEFQPGSGTWHPMFGLAASKRIGNSNIDANLLYLHTREGSQETRIGALLNYNIAWSYRFNAESAEPANAEHNHDEHLHLTWDAIIELNGELRDKNESHHHTEKHSGGNLLYLSPGVRLTIAEKFSVYASIGVPVIDDSNGTQADVDYRTNIGLGASF